MTQTLGMNWFTRAENEISDPLLGSLVYRLGTYTDRVILESKKAYGKAYFEEVLDVCRTSQHIRIHVGDLASMEACAKELIVGAFDAVLAAFCEGSKLPEEHKTEYEKAVKNVTDRRKMIDAERFQIPLAGSN